MIGGDMIIYGGDLVTTTADLTTVKCHLNKMISSAGAKYTTMDIKNFYLGTPSAEYKYARILLKKIPKEIKNNILTI